MATDDNKNVDGKSSANDPKAWQLRLVRADGSQIQLVAEGDTRAELVCISDASIGVQDLSQP